MKKILILILFSSCSAAYQPVKSNFTVPYEKTIDNLTENKNELFVKSNDWLVTNFVKSNSVIEFSDKESGTVIGKYKIFGEKGQVFDTSVYCKINIQVKDKKAKISILPLSQLYYAKGTIFSYTKEQLEKDVQDLFTAYNNYLNRPKSDF